MDFKRKELKNNFSKKVMDVLPSSKIEEKEIKSEEFFKTKKGEKDSFVFKKIDKKTQPNNQAKKNDITKLSEDQKKSKKNKKKKLFLGLLSFVALVIAGYYFFMIFLPKAEIIVTNQKQNLVFEGTIIADKNLSVVNYEQSTIPARLDIFNETYEREFSATGKGRDGRKATGVITVYNNFSTTPQILLANTRFLSADNKVFRLNSRVAVPGATLRNNELIPSSINVEVTADNTGPDYNIPVCQLPCKFTFPGFLGTPRHEGFYGVSNQAMSGGALGEVLMVSQNDLRVAEEAVSKVIFERLSDSVLMPKIPEDIDVLDETKGSSRIIEIKSTSDLGDIVDKFKVSVTGERRILGFKESDLISYLRNKLKDQKESGFDFCGNPEIQYTNIESNFINGTIQLTGKIILPTCYQLDQKELLNLFSGRNKTEIEEKVQILVGIEEVNVELWPWWVMRVPTNLEKVDLKIN